MGVPYAQSAHNLESYVCIVLPDLPIAHAYQNWVTKTLVHTESVPIVVTSREQWADRKQVMAKVLRKCARAGDRTQCGCERLDRAQKCMQASECIAPLVLVFVVQRP